MPIVARLIGRNLDEARQILGASGLAVTLEPDLDRAIDADARGARRHRARAVDSTLFDPVGAGHHPGHHRPRRPHPCATDAALRHPRRRRRRRIGDGVARADRRHSGVCVLPRGGRGAPRRARSLLMVPPLNVLAAVEDALAGGIELLVCITEGVPVHDALKLVRQVRERGAVLIGPSTPGIAVPGRMKIGFLPDAALTPGPLGVMSKSGTLSYEVCYRLAQRGVGQSLWIGSRRRSR